MEKQISALENNLTTNNKMRKCVLDNVDQALLEERFKVQRNAGYPINGPILKHRQKNLQNN
jgi:hypothetical protein